MLESQEQKIAIDTEKSQESSPVFDGEALIAERKRSERDPFAVRENPELVVPNLTDPDVYTRQKLSILQQSGHIELDEYDEQVRQLERWKYQDLMAIVIHRVLEFIGQYPFATVEQLGQYLFHECVYPIPLSRRQEEIIKDALRRYLEDKLKMSRYKRRKLTGDRTVDKKTILYDIGLSDRVNPEEASVVFGDSISIGILMDDEAYERAYLWNKVGTGEERTRAQRSWGFFRYSSYPCNDLTEAVYFVRRSLGEVDTRDTKRHEKAHLRFSRLLDSDLYRKDGFDLYTSLIPLFRNGIRDDTHAAEIAYELERRGLMMFSNNSYQYSINTVRDLYIMFRYLSSLKNELVAYMITNEWKFDEEALMPTEINKADFKTGAVRAILKDQFTGIIEELKRLREMGYPAKSLYLKILTSESIHEATQKLKMIR